MKIEYAIVTMNAAIVDAEQNEGGELEHILCAHEIVAAARALVAAAEAGRWRPIEEVPSGPCAADLLFKNRTWLNQDDSPCSYGETRDHAERCETAFYDGERWRFAGTGHDVYEDWREEMGDLPTHWRPLPPAPEA